MLLSASDPAAIEQAADILAQGGLLGLPTETVYGLAARADDDQAVARTAVMRGPPLTPCLWSPWVAAAPICATRRSVSMAPPAAHRNA